MLMYVLELGWDTFMTLVGQFCFPLLKTEDDAQKLMFCLNWMGGPLQALLLIFY